jgi:hypothetical protein
MIKLVVFIHSNTFKIKKNLIYWLIHTFHNPNFEFEPHHLSNEHIYLYFSN